MVEIQGRLSLFKNLCLFGIKDITLHFYLLDFVRKSIHYAKIILSQKEIASKLSCKQTARLYFSSDCV